MLPRLLRGAPGPKPLKIDPNKVVPLRGFRGEGAPPDPVARQALEYKPPSLLKRHGILAALFLLACLGVIVLLLKVPHGAPRAVAPPEAPIYVEPVTPATPQRPAPQTPARPP
jgi:hypothetical protein